MAHRLESPVPLVALAMVGVAAALGVLAGLAPALAIGAALGGAFVALVLESLVAGLCLMAFLAFLDALPTFGGLSAAKAVGLVLAVAWLAVVLSERSERQLYEAHPLFTYVLILFIGWQAVTVVWAEDQAQYIDSLTRYPPNLLFFPIAYAALRTERHVRLVVSALVGAAILSAILGLVGPASDPAAVDNGRAQGLAGGANELAAALAAGIVLCGGFAFMTWRSPLARPAFAFAAGTCGLAIFLSLSRGGLVALGAAALAAVVFAGRWRARALVASALVVLAAVGYFGAVASLPARERVLEVGGGTGRTDLWTVGFRMIEDRPLIGVGAGNFDSSSIHYLLRPGSVQGEFIITAPKVAHNTLIEVFAESGLIGGSLFVAIILASLFWMWRAALAFETAGARDMEIMSRSLLVGTIGYLTAAMFISANYSKLLWLLLALGPGLYAVSRRRASIST